jgi:hypothetical protein
MIEYLVHIFQGGAQLAAAQQVRRRVSLTRNTRHPFFSVCTFKTISHVAAPAARHGIVLRGFFPVKEIVLLTLAACRLWLK